jgi:hypothetical protein
MKSPTKYTLLSLVAMAHTDVIASSDGVKWFPARPEGYSSVSHRFRIAWLVFTGKCDAVEWPGELI